MKGESEVGMIDNAIIFTEEILNEHDKQIRADAIDEFVEFAKTMPTVEEEDGEIRPMWLEEMAEQLRKRGK